MTASANLDLVRSIFADWERGDFSSSEWAHPEIEFVILGEVTGLSTWTGLAGMAEGWRGNLSVWEDLRVKVDEYSELDGERVLVLTHQRGRGKKSGLEIKQLRSHTATLFHVREGKVTRLVIYSDRDRALADLGLASEGDTS